MTRESGNLINDAKYFIGIGSNSPALESASFLRWLIDFSISDGLLGSSIMDLLWCLSTPVHLLFFDTALCLHNLNS